MSLFGDVSDVLRERYDICVEVGLDHAPESLAVEYANLTQGRIRLAQSRSAEQQAFLLAHVFGHLVQHLTIERYAALVAHVESQPPLTFTAEEESRYLAFEMEAYGWGEVLLRQAAVIDDAVMNRYRAYASVDFTTYLSYLKSGVQTPDAVFQQMLSAAQNNGVPPLWDSSGWTLPDSLVFDDVRISVK